MTCDAMGKMAVFHSISVVCLLFLRSKCICWIKARYDWPQLSIINFKMQCFRGFEMKVLQSAVRLIATNMKLVATPLKRIKKSLASHIIKCLKTTKHFSTAYSLLLHWCNSSFPVRFYSLQRVQYSLDCYNALFMKTWQMNYVVSFALSRINLQHQNQLTHHEWLYSEVSIFRNSDYTWHCKLGLVTYNDTIRYLQKCFYVHVKSNDDLLKFKDIHLDLVF